MVLQHTIYSSTENKSDVDLDYVPERESNLNLALSNRGFD
jgi:hypothetical protein